MESNLTLKCDDIVQQFCEVSTLFFFKYHRTDLKKTNTVVNWQSNGICICFVRILHYPLSLKKTTVCISCQYYCYPFSFNKSESNVSFFLLQIIRLIYFWTANTTKTTKPLSDAYWLNLLKSHLAYGRFLCVIWRE